MARIALLIALATTACGEDPLWRATRLFAPWCGERRCPPQILEQTRDICADPTPAPICPTAHRSRLRAAADHIQRIGSLSR